MKPISKLLLKIISLNIVFVFIMSLFRAAFFFYYGKGIDFTGFGSDILKTFYMGARFDLAVIAYINAPATLLFSIFLFLKTSLMRKYLAFLKYYYALFIGSLFILLCIDFGFFSYFQNHLNILIYGLFEDDTKALFSTLAQNYNLFAAALGFAALFAIVFFLSKFILRDKDVKKDINAGVFVKIILAAVLLFLNFILARGSFGIFPLGVDNAEVSANTFLNKTAINGVYTLQAAIEARGKENKGFSYIEKAGYKNDIRRAFADFLNKNIEDIPQDKPEQSLIVTLPENSAAADIKPNVVLIVMESFGANLIKWNSPQFNVLVSLKEHFDEDTVFYNFQPGHEGTIASLEAVITNIGTKPLAKNISQSQYAYNKYPFSGPRPYKEKGYETSFVYGGNTGWRNVASFMSNLGFDNVYGEGSMNKEYRRNQWGVYDEHLFDFVYNLLDKDGAQKFIYVMSTTNHPPYSLPDDYDPLPLNPPSDLAKLSSGKDLAQMRFKTYQYSNQMLGRFITRIKNSKYAQNTIVAVTGDHNFWGVFTYSDGQLLDSLSVPFYLYIPKKLKPDNTDTSVFGSHMDIMPTLYALSLSSQTYQAMGRNLLSKDAQDNAAFTDSGALSGKNGAVIYDFASGQSRFYVWDKNDGRLAVAASKQESHENLIKYFLSMIAVSDYLLKNGAEK